MTHHHLMLCALAAATLATAPALGQETASPMAPQSEAYGDVDLDDTVTPPERTQLQPARPPPTKSEERRVRTFVPPMRVGMRASFREGTDPGFLTEFGIQLFRIKRVKLDANISVVAPHRIDVIGPFRTFVQLDNTYDLLLVAGRHLEVGPVGGISRRFYNQQWNQVGAAWVPLVGARISTPLIWAPKWSWVVDLKGTVDLAQTEMILETQQVVFMDLPEVQIGMRFNFGHGRVPKERKDK